MPQQTHWGAAGYFNMVMFVQHRANYDCEVVWKFLLKEWNCFFIS